MSLSGKSYHVVSYECNINEPILYTNKLSVNLISHKIRSHINGEMIVTTDTEEHNLSFVIGIEILVNSIFLEKL